MENQSELRQSNIELLRIIAMLMIIAFHFSDHATIKITSIMPMNIDWLVMAFIRVGGAIGNCVFVLITGYFLWRMKFNVRSLVKLWFEVFFYSLVSFVVANYLGFIATNKTLEFIKSLLPISTNQYWYASAYFVLFLFSPVLNRVVARFTERELYYTVLGGLGIFSLWHNGLRATWLSGCNNIIIFTILYLLGAYLGKYGKLGFSKNIYNFLVFVLTILLEWMSILSLRYVLTTIGKYTDTGAIFYCVWGMDKVLPIIAAVSLFIFFIHIDIGYGKLINGVASTVFGCYLLHIGRLWKLFFNDWFNVERVYGTNMVILQVLLAVICIFFMACIIDILRQKIIEKPIMILIDKLIEHYDWIGRIVKNK